MSSEHVLTARFKLNILSIQTSDKLVAKPKIIIIFNIKLVLPGTVFSLLACLCSCHCVRLQCVSSLTSCLQTLYYFYCDLWKTIAMPFISKSGTEIGPNKANQKSVVCLEQKMSGYD